MKDEIENINIDICIIATIIDYIFFEIQENEGYDTNIGNSMILLKRLIKIAKQKIRRCGMDYIKLENQK